MKKNAYYFFLTLLLFVSSCTSQNCLYDYKAFTSYQQLNDYVKENFDSKTVNPKSSWIDKLYYCGCGEGKGYLVMETKRKSYSHRPMSIAIWEELQVSDDVGSYYAREIKGKYIISKSELLYN